MRNHRTGSGTPRLPSMLERRGQTTLDREASHRGLPQSPHRDRDEGADSVISPRDFTVI